MTKNIELEFRAEVDSKKFKNLLRKLQIQTNPISFTRRLSVMYFGKSNKKEPLDIRVRVTNGAAEIALKKGALHSHDRVEIITPIDKSIFLDMVNIFYHQGFETKVAERETHNFNLGNNIIFSLVKAGKIAYVEVEKMSSKKDIEKNKKQVLGVMSEYGLNIIKSKREFDELCDRLSKYSDWKYKNSNKDQSGLKKLVSKYSK